VLPGAAEHPPELPELAPGAATQWPAELQSFGATQSATEVHEVAHFPVPLWQIYGEQSVDPPTPAPPVVFIDV
jgi:hypothetical protein